MRHRSELRVGKVEVVRRWVQVRVDNEDPSRERLVRVRVRVRVRARLRLRLKLRVRVRVSAPEGHAAHTTADCI